MTPTDTAYRMKDSAWTVEAYRALVARVRAEIPSPQQTHAIKEIKTARYDAALRRAEFDWEAAYAEHGPQIRAALKTLEEEADDLCMDNYRIARHDSPSARRRYAKQRKSGCCGSMDSTIVVEGVKYLIGFNYGHR